MYEFYTDGATSNNGLENSIGGYAWVLIKDGERVSQYSNALAPATNNICELKGIISACQYISEKLDSLDNVKVYSDSAYCINCYIQKWYRKWQNNNWKNTKKELIKNKELWVELIPFFEDSRFQFIKVKGHDGNEHNEYVDYLAVKARLDYEKEVINK